MEFSATGTSSANTPKTTNSIVNRNSLQQEYGTKTVIHATPFPCDPSHRLSPFICHNIKNTFHDDPHHADDDSFREAEAKADNDSLVHCQNRHPIHDHHQNFTVTFLGTGAGGRANIKRAPSCTALRLSGCTFLFDAGEGTQRQLAMTKNLGVKDIVKIFVTHLHADHVAGLMGIILQKEMGASGVREEHHDHDDDDDDDDAYTLEIYGPKGIYDYIVMNVVMTCSRIKNLNIVIYELIGGSDLRRTKQRQRHAMTYQVAANIQLRTIEMGNDGTWTLQKVAVLKENDVQQGRGMHRRVGIKAAEVLHLPGVQTFGYVVEECTPSAKINVEKAKALGLSPGPKYRSLKNGYAVMSDDGLRQVTPEQVMVMDGMGKKRARKFALLGDAWKVPKPMMDLCHGADLLAYEATLEDKLHEVAKLRGHSTANMAGTFARVVKAKILAMNHISGRHDRQQDGRESTINDLVRSAERANSNTSHILVAHDFLMISIPEQYEGIQKEGS
eukprot:CAMPEP_0176483050 /NCGR_PEP_ID=MMETSP0200_2-20121128/3715_1 /TAXON_ID=947934 /ORGANISM="Chaetoceros sp., Strain GSL56" /LENGTH=500 /DNA_ID=CAMNT_0017879433 /DNA_START=433 /DNA_END=1936 /DNA_ORIENTATION=+